MQRLLRVGLFSVFGFGVLWASPDLAIAQKVSSPKQKSAAQIAAQLKLLKALPSPSPCVEAVIIALENPGVRTLVIEKAADPCNVFKKICCLGLPRIPGYEYVLFDFDCENCVCLVDPQFLVVVDRNRNKVVDIQDPYLGPTKPCLPVYEVKTKTAKCCAACQDQQPFAIGKEQAHGYIKLINATSDLERAVFVIASSNHCEHYQVTKGASYTIAGLPAIGFAAAAFNPKNPRRRAIGGDSFQLRVPFEVSVEGAAGSYRLKINPLE